MAPNYPDHLNVIKITTSDGFEYWAYPMRPTEITQEKPSTSISLPGQGPRQNVLMGLQGMSRTVPIKFFLWDDGEDKANGTAPQDGTFTDSDGDGTEDVVTIAEQIEYLLDHFHEPDFSVGWTVEQKNGYFESRLPSFDGHLENMRIPLFEPANIKWVPVVLELEVGDSI